MPEFKQYVPTSVLHNDPLYSFKLRCPCDEGMLPRGGLYTPGSINSTAQSEIVNQREAVGNCRGSGSIDPEITDARNAAK